MRRFVLSVILLFLLSACGQTGMSELVQGADGLKRMEMPERMPDDFNFSIQFGFEKKNEINTYEGTVTKDLIVNGTAEADIMFTSEEMNQIYEMMKEVNIFESKKLEPTPIFGEVCVQEPHEDDQWRISVNGETIELAVSGAYCNPTKDAEQLMNLRNDIFHMVKGKEAYQKLPEPVGGYD